MLGGVLAHSVALPVWAWPTKTPKQPSATAAATQKGPALPPTWAKTALPSEISEAIAQWDASFPPLHWWRALGNPELTLLTERALAHNWELQSMAATVQVAKLEARKALAKELPRVTVGPQWSIQKNSNNVVSPTASQFQNTGPRLFAPGQTFQIFNLPLTLNYELDILLKNRLATRSLVAQAQAQQLRYREAELKLAAYVVGEVLKGLQLQQAKALAQQELALLQRKITLQQQRFGAGLEDALPTLAEQQRLQQAEHTLWGLEQQWADVREHVQLALGAAATDTEALEALTALAQGRNGLPTSLQATLPKPQGVASALAHHRPDVMAVESDLQAAGLQVQWAKRSFFPTINLTAQVGLASTRLSNWFNWDSFLASLAAGLVQPLFAGGEIRATYNQKKAAYQQHLNLYRNQVLKAYTEVEGTLARLQEATLALETTTVAVQQQQRALALSQARFGQGLLSQLPVLDAQLALVNQQRMAMQAQNEALQHWVLLHFQLGGGA